MCVISLVSNDFDAKFGDSDDDYDLSYSSDVNFELMGMIESEDYSSKDDDSSETETVDSENEEEITSSQEPLQAILGKKPSNITDQIFNFVFWP